jgi:hypothetical protein
MVRSIVVFDIGEIGIEPLAEFLAGLEEWYPFLLDEDRIACPRIAA